DRGVPRVELLRAVRRDVEGERLLERVAGQAEDLARRGRQRGGREELVERIEARAREQAGSRSARVDELRGLDVDDPKRLSRARRGGRRVAVAAPREDFDEARPRRGVAEVRVERVAEVVDRAAEVHAERVVRALTTVEVGEPAQDGEVGRRVLPRLLEHL